MRPLLSQQRGYSADIEQHRPTLEAHCRIIERVVKDELPGEEAVVKAHCGPRFRNAVTLVSVSVGSFDYRGLIND